MNGLLNKNISAFVIDSGERPFFQFYNALNRPLNAISLQKILLINGIVLKKYIRAA